MLRYFRLAATAHWARRRTSGRAWAPRHHARAVDDSPGQFAVSDHDSPHLHMVAPDPSGQFVIANDAGLDLTLVWRFDASAGRLLPAEVPVIAAPLGLRTAPFCRSIRAAVFSTTCTNMMPMLPSTITTPRAAACKPQAARAERCRRNSQAAISPPKSSSPPMAGFCMSRIACTMRCPFSRWATTVNCACISEAWVHADSPRSLAIDPSGDISLLVQSEAAIRSPRFT